MDGSGISTNYRWDYRSSKYKIRQRFFKLHTFADAETKELIDYKLTSDEVGDNRKFLTRIKESTRRGDTVYADGAYDSKKNFDYLDKHGIRTGIRIRKNFSIN
jgi:IS5 family transposase